MNELMLSSFPRLPPPTSTWLLDPKQNLGPRSQASPSVLLVGILSLKALVVP